LLLGQRRGLGLSQTTETGAEPLYVLRLDARRNEVIVGPRQHVVLVHLVGDKQLIAARMAARKNHFMPTSLLDSQFATLEAPQDDEKPFRVAIDQAPATIIQTIADGLKLSR
jgi:gluconokinase